MQSVVIVECPPGYVRCSTGQCVPDYQVCDGVNDCPNVEDELNCGKSN